MRGAFTQPSALHRRRALGAQGRMHNGRTTLNKFIIEEQRRAPGATGEFSSLLNDLVTACKVIAQTVSRGALAGVLGSAERVNVQGEEQKKLDVLANEILLHHCEWGGHLAAMASEEMDEPYAIPSALSARQVPARVRSAGRLVQHRRQHLGRHHLLGPALPRRRDRARERGLPAARHPPGLRRLRASTGPRRCSCSPSGAACTASRWTARSASSSSPIPICASRPTRRSSPSTPPTSASGSRRCGATSRNASPAGTAPRGKDFNMRWIASLVAEVHRILMRGGLFMYPRDTKDPAKPGRLRLLYEANPMAMIVEQAGGAASHRARAHAGGAAAGAAPARAGDPRLARRGRAHRALSPRVRPRRRPAVQLAAVQRRARCSAPPVSSPTERIAAGSEAPSCPASHPDHRDHRLVGRRHHLGHPHLPADLPPREASTPRSSRAIPSTATTGPR